MAKNRNRRVKKHTARQLVTTFDMQHKVKSNNKEPSSIKTVTYTIVKRYPHHVHCTYEAGGHVFDTSFQYQDIRRGFVE